MVSHRIDHKRPSSALLASLLIPTGVALLVILYAAFLRPQPAGFETRLGTNDLGEMRVAFQVDRDTVMWPSACVMARWEVNAVRAVYLNGDGVPGQGSEQICLAPENEQINPELRVVFPDGSERRYDLIVDVLAYNAAFWLLAAGALLMLLVGLSLALRIRIRSQHVLLVALLTGIALSVFQVGLHAAHALLADRLVWDDAYMFVRYLYNLEHHGVFAWNVAEGPAYGLTEMLYALPVYLVSRVIPYETPGAIVRMTSLLCGVAFLLLVAVLAWRTVRGGVTRRLALLFAVGLGLAVQPGLGVHFISGMGTTFAMAYATLFILLAGWAVRRRRLALLVASAIWGGLAYWVRPDLLLFSTVFPVALFLDPERRRDGVVFAAVLVVTVGLQMGLSALYFGSALPLPFYAKSTGIYDSYYENRYAAVPLDELSRYIQANAVLLLPFAAALVVAPRRCWGRLRGAGAAWLVALAGYIAYYLFFVLQVMHYSQRFYYPTLPFLVLLALIGGDVLLEWLRDPNQRGRLRQIGALLPALVLAAASGFAAPGLARMTYQARAADEPLFLQKTTNQLAWIYARVWFEVQHFSQISPELVVATTDVGLPGIANYEWTVIDLASLNQTRFIHEGFSAEVLLGEYQPDLIYMPGPHYVGLSETLLVAPLFAENYDFYPASRLGNYTDVALRKDSPFYEPMRAVVEAVSGQEKDD